MLLVMHIIVKKNLFNELDILKINYDIFANVGSHIEYRLYNNKYDKDKDLDTWNKYFTQLECLKNIFLIMHCQTKNTIYW